jgi:hypothetical protein
MTLNYCCGTRDDYLLRQMTKVGVVDSGCVGVGVGVGVSVGVDEGVHVAVGVDEGVGV